MTCMVIYNVNVMYIYIDTHITTADLSCEMYVAIRICIEINTDCTYEWMLVVSSSVVKKPNRIRKTLNLFIIHR